MRPHLDAMTCPCMLPDDKHVNLVHSNAAGKNNDQAATYVGFTCYTAYLQKRTKERKRYAHQQLLVACIRSSGVHWQLPCHTTTIGMRW